MIIYAYNFRTDTFVEIDPSQLWFWLPAWQAMEREAERQWEAGEYEEFETIDEMLEEIET